MVKIKNPNFMCIGATKSATTSLYDILKQHPEIGLPSFKEPHFFDNIENYKRGKKWYLENYFKNFELKKSVGEFTPTYLTSDLAPSRILNLFGDKMKFIVLLRNPIDRAYSHFLHTQRDTYEQLNFLDALKEERYRLELAKKNTDDISFLRYSYVFQSQYAIHIKRYLQYFSIKQFQFVLFDDFVKEREVTIKKILDFLDVSNDVDLDIHVYSNKSSIARSESIKLLIKRDTVLKRLAKLMIPSFVWRQKIRNIIHATNNKPKEKRPLSVNTRKNIYLEFFQNDVVELEKMLNLNLNDWQEC